MFSKPKKNQNFSHTKPYVSLSHIKRHGYDFLLYFLCEFLMNFRNILIVLFALYLYMILNLMEDLTHKTQNEQITVSNSRND